MAGIVIGQQRHEQLNVHSPVTGQVQSIKDAGVGDEVASQGRVSLVGRVSQAGSGDAGTLLTAAKLYGSADQVSRARDAEAIKTLGLKAVTTAGKWALKLTPAMVEWINSVNQ